MPRGRRASSRFRLMWRRSCPMASWQRIPGDAGFPAGLERTIVVDLTGKLPAGTRRIRLVTNLEDLLGPGAHRQPRRGRVRGRRRCRWRWPREHFRGYPKQIEGASPGDLDYDYNRVSLTGPFQHQRGNYTHFGDVTPLVRASTTATPSSAAAKRLRRSSIRRSCRRCRRIGSATTFSTPTGT